MRIQQHTPAKHLPDCFGIVGRHVTLTAKLEVLRSESVSSTVNGEERDFTPTRVIMGASDFMRGSGLLLLGAPTRTYVNTVLSGQRCSNITLEAMRKSHAVSAKHLRHSAMSKVFQWADGHADRRSTWDRALASARHSQVTFYRSHHLRLDDWTLQAIGSVLTGASLEDVLMSSAGHTWPDAGNWPVSAPCALRLFGPTTPSNNVWHTRHSLQVQARLALGAVSTVTASARAVVLLDDQTTCREVAAAQWSQHDHRISPSGQPYRLARSRSLGAPSLAASGLGSLQFDDAASSEQL